ALPHDRRPHEPALPVEWDLDRRPGDLRYARRLRRPRRLPRHLPHGGHRADEAAQAVGPAGEPRPARHHVVAEMGAERNPARRPPDVVAALPVLLWGESGAALRLVLPLTAAARLGRCLGARFELLDALLEAAGLPGQL